MVSSDPSGTFPSPDVSAPMSRLRDRAIGCLVGLAVGDAVGTTLEFATRDRHAPLTDMIGGGPFDLRPGEWTDDTSMALCLADSLIANGDLDEADLMRRFLNWRLHGYNSHNGRCFDIGNTTSAALQRFEHTGKPFAGSTDPDTAGNGSIMRLAPVAIRHFGNRARAVDVARRRGATTHGAPAAVDGCALLASLLIDAITGVGPPDLLTPRAFLGHPDIAKVAKGSFLDRRRETISSSGYVVDTLEAALWCLKEAADFRGGVLIAANLGDDADTVAAVTGQLAGALWGETSIPDDWRRKLVWYDGIRSRAERLFERGLEDFHRANTEP
jgi:ADP-ribosyl-[dinitrogen reductase] hydrolase